MSEIFLIHLVNENQQIKKVEQDNIIYSLNEEEKIASVIGINKMISEIIIPTSINYETKEYIVTSISEGSFINSKIKSLKFAPDSKLKTIEKDAFCRTSIESIIIPSQITELKEGWCNRTSKLTKIIVSTYNQYFTLYEENIIIGINKPDQTNNDCLVFCSRNIKNIKIPDFIEYINPYAFNECQLRRIEFSKNSKLKIIDNNSFRASLIENFTIPSQVIEIREKAFFCCFGLKRFEIPNNSKLEIIGMDAFANSPIERITIPSQVTRIGIRAFHYCLLLRYVDFSINSKLQIIDNFAFFETSIVSISLPPQVTQIGLNAFSNCDELKIVELNDNLNLKNIDMCSFGRFYILMIPVHLKKRFKEIKNISSLLKTFI